jgi:hypothetical protein
MLPGAAPAASRTARFGRIDTKPTAINRLRCRRAGAAYDRVAASTRAVDRLGGTHEIVAMRPIAT